MLVVSLLFGLARLLTYKQTKGPISKTVYSKWFLWTSNTDLKIKCRALKL